MDGSRGWAVEGTALSPRMRRRGAVSSVGWTLRLWNDCKRSSNRGTGPCGVAMDQGKTHFAEVGGKCSLRVLVGGGLFTGLTDSCRDQ